MVYCSDCGVRIQRKGLCPICKSAYNKQWYKKNRHQQLARVKKNNKRYREEAQAFIIKAKDVPCADCGHKFHHVAMDFDHLGKEPKFMSISAMKAQARTLASIKREIKKCEVVCANCHRIRTFVRSSRSSIGRASPS